MPNHIHLIAVPERETAMAQAMGRTNGDFARYYNLRKRSSGHVWQARYHSSPLDGPRRDGAPLGRHGLGIACWRGAEQSQEHEECWSYSIVLSICTQSGVFASGCLAPIL